MPDVRTAKVRKIDDCETLRYDRRVNLRNLGVWMPGFRRVVTSEDAGASTVL
jgi:hypothetical protein